jgi:hypothetical protein
VSIPESRGFRIAFWSALALAAAGIVLAIYGHSLPVFIVLYDVATAARHRWCSLGGDIIDHDAAPHFWALFGNHYWLQDLGAGLFLLGLAVAGMMGALRFLALNQSGPWFRTPGSRWDFGLLLFGAFVWAGLESSFSGPRDLARGYACGDALQRIAIFTPILFGILGGVAALLCSPVTLAFGRLPVSLLVWDRDRPIRSWLVTIASAPLMLGAAGLIVIMLASSGSLAAPAGLVLLYLVAATRAALLAPSGKESGRTTADQAAA